MHVYFFTRDNFYFHKFLFRKFNKNITTKYNLKKIKIAIEIITI